MKYIKDPVLNYFLEETIASDSWREIYIIIVAAMLEINIEDIFKEVRSTTIAHVKFSIPGNIEQGTNLHDILEFLFPNIESYTSKDKINLEHSKKIPITKEYIINIAKEAILYKLNKEDTYRGIDNIRFLCRSNLCTLSRQTIRQSGIELLNSVLSKDNDKVYDIV
jgi:triphosphoribosyl-dephospho-CoA synthetase